MPWGPKNSCDLLYCCWLYCADLEPSRRGLRGVCAPCITATGRHTSSTAWSAELCEQRGGERSLPRETPKLSLKNEQVTVKSCGRGYFPTEVTASLVPEGEGGPLEVGESQSIQTDWVSGRWGKWGVGVWGCVVIQWWGWPDLNDYSWNLKFKTFSLFLKERCRVKTVSGKVTTKGILATLLQKSVWYERLINGLKHLLVSVTKLKGSFCLMLIKWWPEVCVFQSPSWQYFPYLGQFFLKVSIELPGASMITSNDTQASVASELPGRAVKAQVSGLPDQSFWFSK